MPGVMRCQLQSQWSPLLHQPASSRGFDLFTHRPDLRPSVTSSCESLVIVILPNLLLRVTCDRYLTKLLMTHHWKWLLTSCPGTAFQFPSVSKRKNTKTKIENSEWKEKKHRNNEKETRRKERKKKMSASWYLYLLKRKRDTSHSCYVCSLQKNPSGREKQTREIEKV